MGEWLDLSQKRPQYLADEAFYEALRTNAPRQPVVTRLAIPPYSGRGFVVKAGQSFRVIGPAGPQIGDVAFWNAADPRERFGAMQTWLVEGWIIRPHTRLWSELPWFRPMLTCIEDTMFVEPDAEYHHHFMGTHCSPETSERRFDVAGLNGCRMNLLQAIEPFGLSEANLRENINVHEKDWLDPRTGKRRISQTHGKPGDYIEFYAEMDLIVAVSVCPYGDGTSDPTTYRERPARPLSIEICNTGVEPVPLPRWTEWRAQK